MGLGLNRKPCRLDLPGAVHIQTAEEGEKAEMKISDIGAEVQPRGVFPGEFHEASGMETDQFFRRFGLGFGQREMFDRRIIGFRRARASCPW